eukprot:92328_1
MDEGAYRTYEAGQAHQFPDSVDSAHTSTKKQLNDLWHETIMLMEKQPVFQQQSDVLNRLKSYDFEYVPDDYNDVLHQILEIHQLKSHIHSEEVLARNILQKFGFVVPQLAGIKNIYKNIIKIYRKMEEIEKYKMNHEANNKFIHILDDFKYDEDFKNNEDNIIADFKPKTIGNTPNANVYDTKCSRKPCHCLERMRLSVSNFISLDIRNENDQNQLVQYCIEEHPTLIDDYIHLTTEHSKGCDQNTLCNATHCVILQRYENRQTQPTKTTTAGNDHFVFFREILDAMHCFLHHPNIGSIQTKKYNLIKSSLSASGLEELCRYMLD